MAKEKDVKIIAGKVCVSTSALYEILDVNESTLVRWAERGCPKVQRGWWSIKDVLDWRNASFKAMTENDIDKMSISEKKTYYDGKVKEAQLEALNLKNKIAQGDYIAKGEIVEELQRFLVVLKRSMLGFSRKIAADLSHLVEETEARRIGKLVSETTASVLEQLSIDGVYEAKGNKKSKNKAGKYIPPSWIKEALKTLKPPEQISVSDYSDKNRILGSENAEPGKWNTSRTPYLKVIMDTYNDPDVEEVGFVKPTQVGGTEALNNMVGYAVAQEATSNLIVLPTTDLADYSSAKRIQPMIRLNSDLKEKWDEQGSKLSELNFKNGASVYFSGANSPSSLASKPIKNCLFDEVDKYPLFSGKEADPISLAKQRQMTFKADKFSFAASTPTTKIGAIWKIWLAADRRFEYYVPCPHCGHFQTFKFKNGIKWDKDAKTADERKENCLL